jgi:hypothetical protein
MSTGEKTNGAVCGHPKRSGEPCQAKPTTDGRCFWHSERFTPEEKHAAVTRGGYIATRQSVLAKIETPASLATEEGARQLIEQTIDQVRTGQISPNVANAIGYLTSVGLKLAELKLSAEIAALEAELARMNRR